MIDPFAIFKVEQNGRVRWVRAIADLQRAKSYILKALSIATAADYIILNQRTGERMIIQALTEPRDPRFKISSPTAGSRN
jgi:hypothetical protein